MSKNIENTIFNLLLATDIDEIVKKCGCSKVLVYKVLEGSRNNSEIFEFAKNIVKIRLVDLIESINKTGLLNSPISLSDSHPRVKSFTKKEIESILKLSGIEGLIIQIKEKENKALKSSLKFVLSKEKEVIRKYKNMIK